MKISADMYRTNKELFASAIVGMNDIREQFVLCANSIKKINENFDYISKTIGSTPVIDDPVSKEFLLSDVGDDKFPITLSMANKIKNPFDRLKTYTDIVNLLLDNRESFVSKYSKLKERTTRISKGKGKRTPEENASMSLLRKITEIIKVVDKRIYIISKHFNSTRVSIFKRILGSTEIFHGYIKDGNVSDIYDDASYKEFLSVINDIRNEEEDFTNKQDSMEYII
jgi:hypothetical protein